VTSLSSDLRDRTIQDFGDQWTRYSGNEGYYGSVELFRDICEPLVPIAEFAGARVADIGSGSGRIVRMLVEAGAAHVTAVEPSDAIVVLEANTADLGSRVTCVHATGDRLPADLQLDWVVSIGVIHHIPDPDPVLRCAYRALRPGGRLLVWVYGREGNQAYLRIAEPLRVLTTRLPHVAIAALSAALSVALSLYIGVARIVPVPLRDYVLSTVAPLSWRKRRLVVYDQLRPTFAKYYSEREVRELLARCGFQSIATHHRHGYSWTAVGVRR